jgi:hypothetical protein
MTTVRWLEWPAAPPKGDAHDFEVFERDRARLDELIRAAQPFHTYDAETGATCDAPESPSTSSPGPGIPYLARDDGLYWKKTTKDGTVEVRLTNFAAHIIADIVRDDGAETRREMELEAALRGRRSRFILPADAFQTMAWPIRYLGSGAVVEPGIGLRDRARTAVQELSGEVPERTVYGHVGWRQINGRRLYLHAGGALGADGPVETVEVSLGPPLDRYLLPAPPAGALRAEAVRTSLRLLTVGPDSVMVPSLGTAYRAPLGRADFGLFIVGPTGVGKSELTALLQQHFGAGMDRQNLPGTWSSTGNALEGLAFLAKDAVLAVDDFAPSGSQADVQRYHREADRLLRAQGNNAGRHRLRADTTLRSARSPRGIVISTGEDVPRGQSARARVLIVEVERGAIKLEALTPHQDAAVTGRLAEAMAGYVCWLAGRSEDIDAARRADVRVLRSAARGSASHARTPEIVANLATGWRWWLSFAVDVGAITDAEAASLWSRVWTALGTSAASQDEHQRASEPTQRFLELLASAVATGRAHVASVEGSEPQTPESWGWRLRRIGAGENARDEWQAQGRRIGWIDEKGLFLEPDGSFAAAQEVGNATGDPLAVTQKTLGKRLQERGLLLSSERGRGRNTMRRELEGLRRTVLHLSPDILDAGVPPEPAQSAHSTRTGHVQTAPPWRHVDDGPISWADPVAADQESTHGNGPQLDDDQIRTEARGSIGPVGTIPEQPSTTSDDASRARAIWRCSGCHGLERRPHEQGGWRCGGCGSRSDDAGRVLCSTCDRLAEDGQRRLCRACVERAGGAA